MQKKIHIPSQNSGRFVDGFPIRNQTGNNCCFEFGEKKELQMKDFTFYDEKSAEVIPTMGLDSDEESPEGDWGFLRPFASRIQSNVIPDISQGFFPEFMDNIRICQEPILDAIPQLHPNNQNSNQQSRGAENDHQKQKEERVDHALKKTVLRIKRTRRVKKNTPVKQKKCKPIKKKPRLKKQVGEYKKQKKRQKNQTKNTVKNYGKQLVKFVHDNRALVQRVIPNWMPGLNYDTLDGDLQNIKNDISKMDHLREIWSGEYGQLMRVISEHFLRRHCFHYIFNSRVQDFRSALKYRKRLQQIVTQPNEQINLKFN